VGKCSKPSISIGIPTHTCVCLEINTRTETLDYFISDKHIKDRVVNVPKDVYFGVWYFICFLFSFIDMKILQFKIIFVNYYFDNYIFFF
jgi:hypothetical protein